MRKDRLTRRILSALGCGALLFVGGPAVTGSSASAPVEQPASTSAQDTINTVSLFSVEQRISASFSSALRLIANPERNIRKRLEAVHRLSATLDSQEIAGLYAFLKARPTQEKNLAGMRYLKNEILTVLRTQSVAPANLAELMIEISADAKQDLVTRDYALQHLALWGVDQAQQPGVTGKIQEAFKMRGQETSSLAGTALLGLHRLTSPGQTAPGREVSLLALKMAGSSEMPIPARVTAIAICSERGVAEVLPFVEALAQNEGPTSLRISAIGALGRLGGPKQRELLRGLESTVGGPAIRSASAVALKRLDGTLASRGPF